MIAYDSRELVEIHDGERIWHVIERTEDSAEIRVLAVCYSKADADLIVGALNVIAA